MLILTVLAAFFIASWITGKKFSVFQVIQQTGKFIRKAMLNTAVVFVFALAGFVCGGLVIWPEEITPFANSIIMGFVFGLMGISLIRAFRKVAEAGQRILFRTTDFPPFRISAKSSAFWMGAVAWGAVFEMVEDHSIQLLASAGITLGLTAILASQIEKIKMAAKNRRREASATEFDPAALYCYRQSSRKIWPARYLPKDPTGRPILNWLYLFEITTPPRRRVLVCVPRWSAAKKIIFVAKETVQHLPELKVE